MADVLDAQGAFADRLAGLAVAPAGHALVLDERHYGLATVMARTGQRAAIGETLGVALPDGPRRSNLWLGVGPDTWLAAEDGAGPYWAAGLAGRLAGLASVADQSSGYAVLRIGGPAARELVSRGAFIDMHPDIFGPDSVAATSIAHIGTTLWQRDGAFEVAMFRSYAGSFWDWLFATAAGMGVVPLRRAESRSRHPDGRQDPDTPTSR